MTWEAWFTIGVVALCFGLMASNRPADVTLVGGITLLLVTGILTPAEALGGLANEGVVTVGVLYVVVTGLRETGAIDWMLGPVLGQPRSLAGAQARMMAPVAAMSAFLNNTPVVAMFIPAVVDWTRKYRLPVSRLMIPLSYASIAGGTCTLIGTSTNLVVNGLLLEQGWEPGIGMFELAWIGIPVTLLTFGYLILLGPLLLPDRKPAITPSGDLRRYVVEMEVEVAGALCGKTVEEAGLRHLPGLFLVGIERDGRVLAAVPPGEPLYGNDLLMFAGIVDSIVDLRKIRGLRPATDQVNKVRASEEQRTHIEAVVSNSCPLAGKSIREGRFRTIYNAAVIAVARNGARIAEKPGDIVLRPGDTLLLEAHPDFVVRHRNSRDFYLVSRLPGSSPPKHDRALRAIAILAAMVLVVATGWLSMLEAALLAAGMMIITRCTTGRTARRSVDWRVLIVIAASFGIGNAMESTGAAAAIAGGLISLSGGVVWTALAAIFTVTAVITALATNNTAAVLMFPVALATAQSIEAAFLPFVITVMVAASASYATPIGYQTNLMVYGPGGYRFTDYVRVGLPLTVAVCAITVAIVPLVWTP
ncbi:MAG: SLC13 family permease [Gammaproteobacteria bacterium]|jgi:di/tricarboxylate transporter|nr:SLC13 family permease [Gammaproteobacteria bacterium]